MARITCVASDDPAGIGADPWKTDRTERFRPGESKSEASSTYNAVGLGTLDCEQRQAVNDSFVEAGKLYIVSRPNERSGGRSPRFEIQKVKCIVPGPLIIFTVVLRGILTPSQLPQNTHKTYLKQWPSIRFRSFLMFMAPVFNMFKAIMHLHACPARFHRNKSSPRNRIWQAFSTASKWLKAFTQRGPAHQVPPHVPQPLESLDFRKPNE